MENELDIAIVGIACRFPGAKTPHAFWHNLAAGVESITRFSDEELIQSGVPSRFVVDPNYIKAAPVLDEPEFFDASFFGFTPKEAQTLDPQHRILLELAYEALENAGCDSDRFPGRIGVFAGSALNTYLTHTGLGGKLVEEYLPTLIANDKDFLSTRLSYKLNLKGPSLSIQTACSTSAVAIHLARQSLLSGETDLALAGAISVRVPHRAGYFHVPGGVVSIDGRVRAFDAKASGTVFGSGGAVIVLERLSDAIANRDPIYAVIKGSAINNDGAGKAGYSAPSVDGQAEAVIEALSNAGVDANSISYVEAHGSGTTMGDPIEIRALSKAFRTFTDGVGYCAIGSVKTNIGHLDVAAGMAGVIKTALALQHRQIPASLHYSEPNPEIDFAKTPFYVNAQLAEWTSSGPRRAGVMSTGMGGTNAHLILEEAPTISESVAYPAPPQLIVLSAKTPTALDTMGHNLAEFLAEPSTGQSAKVAGGSEPHPEVEEVAETLPSDSEFLADVASTLQTGRKVFPYRRVAVCQDVKDAVAALGAATSKEATSGKVSDAAGRPVFFLFPGVGDQYVGMGRELYERFEVFRREVDRCASILQAHSGGDIRQILHPKNSARKRQKPGVDLRKMLKGSAQDDIDPAVQLLNQTRHCQPALFTIEYALAQLWMDWGIKPDRLVGHSMGEYVAACLAGVLSLEDALRLVAVRAALVNELPVGAMLAIPLPENELRPLVTPPLSLSLINGPNLCVVAGPVEAVADLGTLLSDRGVNYRPVRNGHAFHSEMLAPIVPEYEREVRKVQLNKPHTPYISNVTGEWILDSEATDPLYWTKHATHTARFAQALQTMWRQSDALLVEVGPGKGLGALAQQHPARQQASDPVIVSSLPPHYENVSEVATMLKSVGKLWVSGVNIEWNRLCPRENRRRICLPAYPFERRRHWIDTPNNAFPTPGSCGTPIGQSGGEQVDIVAPTNDSTQAPAPARADVSPCSKVLSEVDRREEIAERLKNLIRELSGVEVTSDTATFMELGFESLFLTQASQLFQSKFGVKISFRQLLSDLSSVRALAAYIDQERLSASSGLSPIVRTDTAPSAKAVQDKLPVARDAAADSLGNGGRAVSHALSGLRPVKRPTSAVSSNGARKPGHESKRFGPYKPVEKGEKGQFTPRQQEALNRLIERYVKKTSGSKRYAAEHRPHLADPRAVAGFNTNWKEMVYPIVSQRSKGSKVWDIDGNEYVDITMGFGVYLFGHSPDWLVEALREQMETGIEIGPQSLLAGKVAQLIGEFTGMERVTFCNTGSEAVMAAIRLARTVTGRRRVVFFTGDYHGIFEEVLVRGSWMNGQYQSQPAAPGIPENLVDNMLVLEYGAPESLQIIREHGDEIAAVLVEPVRSRQPGFQPREFLHELRTLTEQIDAPLIFDEMVTGFRCHPGGAQSYFGIRADMATFGKVIGAGIPIGILAGQGKYLDALDGGMWAYGDDSFPEVGMTYFAGTFVRHPLALAASWRTLNYLKAEGPKLQLRLAERVGRFCRTLNDHFKERNLPISLPHFASFATIEHAPDLKYASLLWYYLREKGVLIWENRTLYFTDAHTDNDLDRMVMAFKESVREMQKGGFFPESSPSLQPGRLSLAEPVFPRCDSAPLTEAQREIILAASVDDAANCAYNNSVTIDLRGPLSPSALRASIAHLFDRHPALRSTFSADLETQYFHPAWDGQLTETDLSGLTESEQAERVEKAVSLEMVTPFALVQGPVVRFHLLKASAESHRLILTAHHLVCDGWSISTLIWDLSRVYNALVAERIPLLPPPMRFADFARLQLEKKGDAAYQAAEEFWLSQYAGPAPVLDLPTDWPRPAARTYSGSSERLLIDPDLFSRLKKATPHLGGTIFATLFGVCATMLHRLTSQEDLVIGIPAAGQAALGCPDLVGHCMNFLPVRVKLLPHERFGHLAEAIKRTLLDAYDHQSYTYGTLIQRLKLRRHGGRPPLVSVLFNIDKSGFDTFGFDQLSYTVTANPKRHVNFDLFFNLVQTETSLELGCEYDTDLFDRETIARWLKQFERLIEAVAANAQVRLDELPMLSEKEQARLLLEWNETVAALPKHQTLHGLIEEQAAKTPEAVALEFAGRQLSYRQLDARANHLAHRLRSLGVGPSVLVAISLERSLELMPVLLGVVKAGGAYIFIDPEYPQERRSFMLQDAGVRLLVTQHTLRPNYAQDQVKVFCVDEDPGELERENPHPPVVSVGPADVVYTIFTSGSTGKPKGVQIEHHSLVNFLLSVRRTPGLDASDVLLAVTTLSFDIAGLELYLPLISGAKIVLAAKENASDGEALQSLMQQHHVTVFQATPATWRLLLAAGWKGNPHLKALCGGEALPSDLAASLLPRCAELWNMYGPTETTIWSTCARITSAENIHIGRPIDNTELYILDAHRQLAPTGVIGELFIGGAGVARGYLNRPELTAEKFVPHPFKPNQRLYRTGDVARYRNDGNVECLGRLDHQVKIRGFRIELGEIETALSTHPEVAQCVVHPRESSSGEMQLIAYCTSRPGPSPNEGILREHLRHSLPDYMIPASFIFLEKLPLTPNGKIDRRALNKLEIRQAPSDASNNDPRNLLELRLIHIWEKLFQRSPIGLEDNFFDLGGHSLLATRLVKEVEELIGHRLTIASLFQAPTVSALARLLADRDWSPAWSSLVPLQPRGGRRPLFFVHGWGGNVYGFLGLARELAPEQPVFGLQAVQNQAGEPVHRSVAEMAAHYVKEICSLQPEGPYFIASYSLGGLIAYEMAWQLEKQGRAVGLLALLDTHPLFVPWSKFVPIVGRYTRERIGTHCRKVLELQGQERWSYFLRMNRMLGYVFGVSRRAQSETTVPDASLARGLPEGDDYYWRLAQAYPISQEYEGAIDLFTSSDAQMHKLYYWNYLTRGDVRFHPLPGPHLKLFEPEHLPAMVDGFKKVLARAHQEHSDTGIK